MSTDEVAEVAAWFDASAAYSDTHRAYHHATWLREVAALMRELAADPDAPAPPPSKPWRTPPPQVRERAMTTAEHLRLYAENRENRQPPALAAAGMFRRAATVLDDMAKAGGTQ